MLSLLRKRLPKSRVWVTGWIIERKYMYEVFETWVFEIAWDTGIDLTLFNPDHPIEYSGDYGETPYFIIYEEYEKE
jgi:hypothetical protein